MTVFDGFVSDHRSQLENNNTLPVTVSEVRVLHAANTRRGFLEGIVKPLLRKDAEEPFTLLEAREQIDKVGRKLDKLGTIEMIEHNHGTNS